MATEALESALYSLTFIADFNIGTNEIAYIHSHLAAFIGGNIALAGRLFSRDDWTTLGLELAESAYMTYKATALGLGPYGECGFLACGNVPLLTRRCQALASLMRRARRVDGTT